MSEETKPQSQVSILGKFWSIILLGSIQGLAYGGIFILIVPISNLIWPGEPFHALEMGILISAMFWASSIGGIFFGVLIDRYSRKMILVIISLIRGFCIIMVSLAVIGRGMETWWYFFIYILIFAAFAGGSYPAMVSLANDIIPKEQRSQLFGIWGIVSMTFSLIGFLVAGFLVVIGLWRLFFAGIGIAVLAAGICVAIALKEPKRGAQSEELKEILKDDSVEYNFKMNRETIRKTMLSRTNKVALIEGIFTNIFIGALTILILPYLQSPPHNISPFSTGVFLVCFGLTGGLLGQIYFASLSDKWSKEKHIRRIYLIIVALIGGIMTFAIFFFIPLPHLTVEQGENVIYYLSLPVIWLMGILYLLSTSISALYMINQAPILQDINLPEAQGKITSWNQFLESIAYGSGPLIAGILFSFSGQNYQLTVLIIIFFSIPGVILWFLAIKWYPHDCEVVSKILQERAEELKNRQNGLGD